MGLMCLRCCKCGRVKMGNSRHIVEEYRIDKNRTICVECYNKQEKESKGKINVLRNSTKVGR